MLAYVGKTGSGDYKPFCFNQALITGDIELSDEMFLVTRETAEAYLKSKSTPAVTTTVPEPKPSAPDNKPEAPPPQSVDIKPIEPRKPEQSEQLTFASMAWTSEVPPQKWMKFYTSVLSKFAATKGLKLKVNVEIAPEGGISKQKVEEIKAALRELGMSDDLKAIS